MTIVHQGLRTFSDKMTEPIKWSNVLVKYVRLSAMESLEMRVNFTDGEVNQLRAKEIPTHELQ